jgi:AraC-like DNA-binding protein
MGFVSFGDYEKQDRQNGGAAMLALNTVNSRIRAEIRHAPFGKLFVFFGTIKNMERRRQQARKKPAAELPIEEAGVFRPDKWATRMLRRTTASSELGGISLAGLIRGSPGVGAANRPANRPMRVFGQFAVVYVVGGGGAYRDANGHRQSITPGDLIWVFPKLGHAYGPTGDNAGWNEIYLCFHGPVFNLWARSGLIDERRPVWRLEPIEYWLSRFRWVLAGGLRVAGAARPLVEVCRLQQVLAEALLFDHGSRRGRPAQRLELAHVRGTIAGLLGAGDEITGEASDSSGDPAWAEKACRHLEQNLADGDADGDAASDQTVSKSASAMGMSYEGFRKRFARLLGTSPGRYRAARVMDRACELMQEGVLTDKQIAMTLGFCDEFHFSRRFKAIVGCPPREFRRKVT